jgi:23S rRNA pseudouridine2605 synthase
MKIAKEPISMETPIGDDDDSHLGDFIEDSANTAPIEAAMQAGLVMPDGEHLGARRLALLRHGERKAWIEASLDEGRNRHLRRLCEAFELTVLRLVRVAIGPLALGDLAKGAWRLLDVEEVAALRAGAVISTPKNL